LDKKNSSGSPNTSLVHLLVGGTELHVAKSESN
jgi:hypothetical protein